MLRLFWNSGKQLTSTQGLTSSTVSLFVQKSSRIWFRNSRIESVSYSWIQATFPGVTHGYLKVSIIFMYVIVYGAAVEKQTTLGLKQVVGVSGST